MEAHKREYSLVDNKHGQSVRPTKYKKTSVPDMDMYDAMLADGESDSEKELSDGEVFLSDSDEEFDPSETENETADFRAKPEDKIYSGHYLDVKTSVLVIWLYAVSFGISSIQLSHLLGLLNLHFLVAHPALSSIFKFKKYLAFVKSAFTKHYFCKTCLTLVSETTTECPNLECPKRDLSAANDKGYFLELSVCSQVHAIMSRQDIQQALRKKRNKTRGLSDISDGLIYQKLCEDDGPLSDKYPYNISFTLNTDGVNVVKSHTWSIWPVYLMINELPYALRRQKQNMIVAGIWFSEIKPLMAMFMGPIRQALFTMEREGVDIVVEGKNVNCRGFLICATADIPAKAMLLNMKQHNGEYCCGQCCQPGKNFRTPTGGNVRVLPYVESNPSGPFRSNASFNDDAKEALQSGKHIHGIKGPSSLSGFKYFDMVKGVTIDYMHCVLQGVTKLCCSLWFSSAHSASLFSLHKQVALVDSRIKQIAPLRSITRIPKTVTEYSQWKASELRAWLFYFSVPLLHDVMSRSHLYHWIAFVEALFLLCQESVLPGDLEKAEALLRYFVFMFGTLYGERYLTVNVHYLLHLTETVRNLGPLWAHSCFPFESLNGDLKNMFHGTRFIDTQISNALTVMQQVPKLLSNISGNTAVKTYVLQLQKRSLNHFFDDFYVSPIHFLGKSYVEIIKGSISRLLPSSNMRFYRRIRLSGQVIHSMAYSRARLSNSYTVKYMDSLMHVKHGFVCWFANDEQKGHNICLVKSLKTASIDMCKVPGASTVNPMKLQLKNIKAFEHTEDCYDLVNISNILCLCVCVSSGEIIFVCDQPNVHEINL